VGESDPPYVTPGEMQMMFSYSRAGASGLGLGLYIAREIVAMHGGTIVAESSEAAGTVFSARLPRARTQARGEARA